MHRGDQCSIRFSIRRDGEPLAPADIAGLRIKVGSLEDRYPEGTLSYDAAAGAWMFPITQAQSLAIEGTQQAQVQVNFGGEPPLILGSKVQSCFIENSVIEDEWQHDGTD